MLHFECDYTEGAHEAILKRLLETNREPLSGYGQDPYCERAKEKIRAACGCPEAEVFFLVGGTQTNALVISALLQPHEGVIAAKTGHVSIHEAGAIEFTGHKVIELSQENGKLSTAETKAYLKQFWQDETHEHMAAPGMVYISHPTEYGTLYSLEELQALSSVCRRYQIPLYVDGARLGYGLMSRQTDVTLEQLSELADVFYIGGTKVGALCGEAVVFTKKNAPKYFFSLIKQRGALLAKGRLLGIQFDTLFTDDLYFKISAHAIEMAEQLKEGFAKRGYRFYLDSPTNQQFVILPNVLLSSLRSQVAFSVWEPYDAEHTVVRFATSWATTEEQLAGLWEILDSIC